MPTTTDQPKKAPRRRTTKTTKKQETVTASGPKKTPKPTCDGCMFSGTIARGPNIHSVCMRYPTHTPIQSNYHWCGEFKEKQDA